MPRHVLVIEPKTEVRETIGAILESCGYRVATANGGEAMRDLLGQLTFDAIVIDATLGLIFSAIIGALKRVGRGQKA